MSRHSHLPSVQTYSARLIATVRLRMKTTNQELSFIILPVWLAGQQETKSWLGEDLGLGWEYTRKMSTNSLKIGQLVERFLCILESVHKDPMKDKTRIYFLG